MAQQCWHDMLIELSKASYNCKEASISYIPNTEASLDILESKAYEKLVNLLMQEDIVIDVHSNAS